MQDFLDEYDAWLVLARQIAAREAKSKTADAQRRAAQDLIAVMEDLRGCRQADERFWKLLIALGAKMALVRPDSSQRGGDKSASLRGGSDPESIRAEIQTLKESGEWKGNTSADRIARAHGYTTRQAMYRAIKIKP